MNWSEVKNKKRIEWVENYVNYLLILACIYPDKVIFVLHALYIDGKFKTHSFMKCLNTTQKNYNSWFLNQIINK